MLARSREHRRLRAYVLSFLAIITMFIIALVLWTLDVAIFIVEGKMTLIENPDKPVGERLSNVFLLIFRMVAAEDALYAYMVCTCTPTVRSCLS